jgi:acyl-CoA dehydrogenase
MSMPERSCRPEVEALIAAVRRVGAEVAAAHADEVDKNARFPHEALAALRRERALAACVPRALGGFGASTSEMARMTQALGEHCAATGLIFAMHLIQVGAIVRHGLSSAYLRRYLADVAERQLLLASVTSEVGTGGDLRSSLCAVEPDPAGFRLKKDATTVSYAEHADDLLLTARRAPDAPGSDQVLVLLRNGGFSLERKGRWDTLGMRGTVSPPFEVSATGSLDQIVPAPFGEIAAQTMVPFSHILWGGVWLGIATDATARARAFVRGEAKKRPGTPPPGALRLGELIAEVQLMRAGLFEVARTCDALMGPEGQTIHDELISLGFAIAINNLKVRSSELVVDIVGRALAICGMAGYRADGRLSLGRHLRDAHSARLMINNDRILANNAALVLVHKDR